MIPCLFELLECLFVLAVGEQAVSPGVQRAGLRLPVAGGMGVLDGACQKSLPPLRVRSPLREADSGSP